jgi:hypothetical protein
MLPLGSILSPKGCCSISSPEEDPEAGSKHAVSFLLFIYIKTLVLTLRENFCFDTAVVTYKMGCSTISLRLGLSGLPSLS